MPGTHGGGATRRKSSPGSMKRGKGTYEIGRLELEHELLLLEILDGGQWRISNRQHAWRPAKCDGGRGCWAGESLRGVRASGKSLSAARAVSQS